MLANAGAASGQDLLAGIWRQHSPAVSGMADECRRGPPKQHSTATGGTNRRALVGGVRAVAEITGSVTGKDRQLWIVLEAPLKRPSWLVRKRSSMSAVAVAKRASNPFWLAR